VKLLAIVMKDLTRSFRSAFLLLMMFGVPVGLTALIVLAFGGPGSSETPDVSQTSVLVVNMDEGLVGFGAGQILIDVLTSGDLGSLFSVESRDDASAARAAVDRQEAGVAVLIPAGFSRATLIGSEDATMTVYQDPTLTIGPRVLREVLKGAVDRLSGAAVALGLTSERLAERGGSLTPAEYQALTVEYNLAVSDWLDEALAGGRHPLIVTQSLGGQEVASDSGQITWLIAAGQMVFAAFFAAAYSNESFLREEEEGTLPRLFTTPVRRERFLVGKFLATGLLVLIQSVTIMLAGRLVLSIVWGDIGALAMLEVGLVVAASGLGAFLLSLVDSTRQAGPVIGGALTATSMLGGLFSVGVPNMPRVIEMVTLAFPQGWVIRGWKIAMGGGDVRDVLLPCAVMVAYGGVLFAFGALRFRRRYA